MNEAIYAERMIALARAEGKFPRLPQMGPGIRDNERVARIKAQIAGGVPLTQIAAALHISKQRVEQLVREG